MFHHVPAHSQHDVCVFTSNARILHSKTQGKTQVPQVAPQHLLTADLGSCVQRELEPLGGVGGPGNTVGHRGMPSDVEIGSECL